MKTFLRLIIVACLLLADSLTAQLFETGKIGVGLSNAGRIRVGAPEYANLRQIDRSSILFGVDAQKVYSYNADADSLRAAVQIENPELSDYELSGISDNSWSDLPPVIHNRIRIYGWDDEGFAIIKFTIVNLEESAMNGIMGLEIIPQVQGDYGLESISLEANDVVNIYRRTSISFPTTYYTGYKFISEELVSLEPIEWFAGYDDADADLYGYMTTNTRVSSYDSGTDGSVVFIAGGENNIPAGDSLSFFVGISVGSTKETMLSNMTKAVDKYNSWNTSAEDKPLPPGSFVLQQNYPNPFNPATAINYSIPEDTFVQLSIYNALGQKVYEVVNEYQHRGDYSYSFTASDLSSGVYFYSIQAGNNFDSKKMILIK